jgi:nitroreductase
MDVFTAIKNRRSVRSYSSQPIPAEILERMKQALRCAPSACNLQPWHFIFINDEKLKQKVAHVAHDQTWMADAPVIVAALGFPEEAYKQMAGHRNSVEIDVAIAFDHLTLAAVGEGLGTCWIGAFDEGRMKELLKVPNNAEIIALTPLGFPSSENLNFVAMDDRRKRPQSILSENHYQKPA